MHIELTEMLRCPEPHELGVLVLSTGEIASTAGVTVVNAQRKSSWSTPSAAEARPFAIRMRYVVAEARSSGRKR